MVIGIIIGLVVGIAIGTKVPSILMFIDYLRNGSGR